MNYEIKHINPVSVFANALRIFVVVGFLVALLTFFMPGSTLRYSGFFQKVLATFIFTAVYTIVVSVILALISWLYNVWAANFKGVSIRLEAEQQ